MFLTLYFALFFTTTRCRDIQDFTTKTFNVREDVTLACSHWTAVGGVLFWKKLVPGSLPEVLGATYTFNHVAVHRRPRTETKQEHGAFVLRITQTELDDTAFYYCEAVEEMKSALLNITLLRIKEPETEITAIFQYFEAAVGAENSVKLQCSIFFDVQKEKTCPGGHKVLWFTPELNKTHPSVTYIHHVEECDREAELDSPQKCVYNLSQFDIKSSHAGTFYRAVVTSEEMLCGKRLKVEKDNEAIIRRLSTAVSLLSAALVLSLIGIILLLYAMRKNKCVCFKAAAAAAAAPQEDVEPLASPQQSNQTNEDGLVYSVVNFKRNENSHSSRSGTKSTEDQPNYVDVSNSE